MTLVRRVCYVVEGSGTDSGRAGWGQGQGPGPSASGLGKAHFEWDTRPTSRGLDGFPSRHGPCPPGR